MGDTISSEHYKIVGEKQVISICTTGTETIDVIGKGASSRVFSGRFDNKDVAVKRVFKDDYKSRELDLLRSFHYENIVKYLFQDIDEVFMYIVLEKCDCNLQQFIENESLHKEKDISLIEILRQTTNGLAYLHDVREIIHMDLKPSNVLLLLQDQIWVVKIADFDSSKKLQQNKSKLTLTSIKGTVGNTAPEVLKNGKISKKSDIFSLGILYYFTLSRGEHPYGTDMVTMEGIIRDGKQQPTMKDLDEKYADDAKFLIMSMIAHNCEDRFDITHVQSHHLFWNNEKKIDFIQVVFDYAVAKTTSKVIETKLNENSEPVIGESWRAPVYAVSSDIEEVLEEMRHRKQGDDIMSLLRNIRNLKHHFDEKPTEFKKLMANGGSVNNMEFFFNIFPALISHVYEVMRSVERENPIFKNFFYAKEKTRPVSPALVSTVVTFDELLASITKAMAELSITEKVNVIIMFNELDNHLYSYKISTSLSTKEWSQMQEFPEYRKLLFYTTVVSSKHIYFIQNENVHQLEYSNPAAKWKKISSMKEDHGLNPPAVMLNGFIYVCGNVAREASRSVERYDVALDRWTHMCDMNIGRNDPCVVATEDHIYCIGGLKKQSVERFDERLDKWEYVKSAPTEISFTNAAVVKNRIYVIHDVGFLEDSWKIPGVLCYDVQNDLWSKIKLTIQCPFVRYCVVKILAVDDELYIFGNMFQY